MRALLILYLTKHFLFDDAKAGGLRLCSFNLWLAVIGRNYADRYLGMKKAVAFGAVLLVLGHLQCYRRPAAE